MSTQRQPDAPRPAPCPRYRPPPGAVIAEVALVVPFHDVDALQVVWHGNYLKYFEIARTELERLLRVDISTLQEAGCVCPVVESYCRHASPMRYGDRGKCRAWVADVGRMLTIAYDLVNETTLQKSAEGHTVQVALDRHTLQLKLELPDEILARLLAGAGAPGRVRGSRTDPV